MTRPIEQIESDLLAARQEHAAQVETHRQAVQDAAHKRARAIAGDTSVSAAELAQSEDAARFAELPVPALLRAVSELEAEHLVFVTERWADGVAATEPALRDDVEKAFKAVEDAHDDLVKAWRLHASYISQTALEVGTVVGANVTPRVSRTYFGPAAVVVRGAEIRAIPVHDRLAKLGQQTHDRLFGGTPKGAGVKET